MEGCWTLNNDLTLGLIQSQSLFSWKGAGQAAMSGVKKLDYKSQSLFSWKGAGQGGGSSMNLPDLSQSLFSWKGAGPSESQWIGFWG